jgi:hypothetical protein
MHRHIGCGMLRLWTMHRHVGRGMWLRPAHRIAMGRFRMLRRSAMWRGCAMGCAATMRRLAMWRATAAMIVMMFLGYRG